MLVMFKTTTLGCIEYAQEFEHLMMKCNLEEEETQTWVRFIRGLDYKIVHMVEVLPYKSVEDLVQLAC